MLDSTPAVLTALLTNGPFVVLPLAGLVVIAIRLRGTVQVVGVLGCGLLTLAGIFSIIFQVAVPYLMREFRNATLVSLLGLGNSVVSLAGTAALIVTVCLGRGTAASSVRR